MLARNEKGQQMKRLSVDSNSMEKTLGWLNLSALHEVFSPQIRIKIIQIHTSEHLKLFKYLKSLNMALDCIHRELMS